MNSLPDWKLPAGVTPGVNAYLTDPDIARSYDERLAGTPLLKYDLRFAERFLTPPGRLLDLGCGTGRLLMWFGPAGYELMGVDLSAEMLAVGAQKVRAAGLSASLVRANLVELAAVRDGVFDHAVCLFSTLGMIAGKEQRHSVLSHTLRVLRRGGRFVLHVHNRGFHMWTKAGRRWLFRDIWRRGRGAADAGDYQMPAHDGIVGLALHHFTRDEIVRELKRTGFRVLCVEPVSTREDCRLPAAWWATRWRAYGYLIAAEKA